MSEEDKVIKQLSLLLYPENLEQFSKVTTILNEDFTFKVDELYSLKEIQKITPTKELLLSALNTLSLSKNPIIAFIPSKNEGKILINDKLILYTFINIPSEFPEIKVKEFLEIKDEEIIRLYKQSLFWVLACDNNIINDKLDKKIKNLKVEEDKNLKCNISSSTMLKNAISKMIQKYIYSKETNDLSVKSEKKNEKEKDDDNMSWRKKSDFSDVSNSSSNYGYGNGSHNYQKRRQRFKSDPNENYHNKKKDYWNSNNYKKYEVKGKNEEIQIQLEKIKYSLMIKNSYSNKEIVDYFDKVKDEFKFDKNNFKYFNEEIMSENMKNLEIKEREKLENIIPKNNPLLNFKIKK